jgi:F-type H+-transporting ATPase subunit a
MGTAFERGPAAQHGRNDGALGVLGWLGALVPLAMTVAILALELLVAFLPAYVFAILTCIYLSDAIRPAH